MAWVRARARSRACRSRSDPSTLPSVSCACCGPPASPRSRRTRSRSWRRRRTCSPTRSSAAARRRRCSARALHDPLTGLPNRTLFMDRLRSRSASAVRRRTSVAVLFLDLDRFKLVNDSLGHGAGDELLCQLAARLDACCAPATPSRASAATSSSSCCDDIADAEAGVAIAERITAALAAPVRDRRARAVRLGQRRHRRRDGTSTRREELVRDADAAMYRAKEHGRAGFELFDAIMRARAVERLRSRTTCAARSSRDELRARTTSRSSRSAGGEIVGVEALRALAPPGARARLPGRVHPGRRGERR